MANLLMALISSAGNALYFEVHFPSEQKEGKAFWTKVQKACEATLKHYGVDFEYSFQLDSSNWIIQDKQPKWVVFSANLPSALTSALKDSWRFKLAFMIDYYESQIIGLDSQAESELDELRTKNKVDNIDLASESALQQHLIDLVVDKDQVNADKEVVDAFLSEVREAPFSALKKALKVR